MFYLNICGLFYSLIRFILLFNNHCTKILLIQIELFLKPLLDTEIYQLAKWQDTSIVKKFYEINVCVINKLYIGLINKMWEYSSFVQQICFKYVMEE